MPNLGASQFVVGRGGIARIELEPTSTMGRFALTLQLAGDQREEIEGWLSPGRREFTLVGLGTAERGFASSDTGSGNSSIDWQGRKSDGDKKTTGCSKNGDAWSLRHEHVQKNSVEGNWKHGWQMRSESGKTSSIVLRQKNVVSGRPKPLQLKNNVGVNWR